VAKESTRAQMLEATNPAENLLTAEKSSSEQIIYNPQRLKGISAYRELELGFATGDRIQFTASDKQLGVANRELAAIEKNHSNGEVSVRTDKGRELTFDPREHRHFDHGYAVTSHSAQGLTAERVLINVDSGVHPELLNSRFAYVSVSRASGAARLFTDDIGALSRMLSMEAGKSSALEFSRSVAKTLEGRKQQLRKLCHTSVCTLLRRGLVAELFTIAKCLVLRKPAGLHAGRIARCCAAQNIICTIFQFGLRCCKRLQHA